jgi:hypothetical protein
MRICRDPMELMQQEIGRLRKQVDELNRQLSTLVSASITPQPWIEVPVPEVEVILEPSAATSAETQSAASAGMPPAMSAEPSPATLAGTDSDMLAEVDSADANTTASAGSTPATSAGERPSATDATPVKQSYQEADEEEIELCRSPFPPPQSFSRKRLSRHPPRATSWSHRKYCKNPGRPPSPMSEESDDEDEPPAEDKDVTRHKLGYDDEDAEACLDADDQPTPPPPPPQRPRREHRLPARYRE